VKFVTASLAIFVLGTAALCAGSVRAQQNQNPTPGQAGTQSPAAPSQAPTPGQAGTQSPAPNQTPTSGQAVTQGQAPSSPTFTFKVCNKTKRSASVAIAAMDDTKKWYAQGWWAVSAGECSTVGAFAKGWFYYYAKSSTGDWHGTGSDVSKTCVRSSAFKRSDPDGYECGKGETLVAFNGKNISDDSFTWNIE
jgi:uncharacterized membrane protein